MLSFFTNFSPSDVIYVLDIIGVIGCAISGTIQAYRYGLDPLGALMIAAVTAMGGGTLRDLLLDRNPVFWLADETYLCVIIVVSLLVQVLYQRVERINKILRVTDAIGLATFTIIGVDIAFACDMSPLIAVFMGIMTSCFGGVVRDIICNEVPLVLHKEIYISASLLGGVCFSLLRYLGFDSSLVYLISGLVAFWVRMIALYRGWHLPRLG